MPDLTLYRDQVEKIAALLDKLRAVIPAYPHSPDRQAALRLAALLRDRLSQGLHPPPLASCDVCGALRPLSPVPAELCSGIETFACAQCQGIDDWEEADELNRARDRL